MFYDPPRRAQGCRSTVMRRSIIALSALFVASPAIGQQANVCDLLKAALAGNAVIDSKAPRGTPANMAWPTGSTTAGSGSYSVTLFQGVPSAADVSKMQQAIATADRQVAQCFPTARRTVGPVGASDREISYCVAGSPRSISIASSQASRLISAHLAVETSSTKPCR